MNMQDRHRPLHTDVPRPLADTDVTVLPVPGTIWAEKPKSTKEGPEIVRGIDIMILSPVGTKKDVTPVLTQVLPTTPAKVGGIQQMVSFHSSFIQLLFSPDI